MIQRAFHDRHISSSLSSHYVRCVTHSNRKHIVQSDSIWVLLAQRNRACCSRKTHSMTFHDGSFSNSHDLLYWRIKVIQGWYSSLKEHVCILDSFWLEIFFWGHRTGLLWLKYDVVKYKTWGKKAWTEISNWLGHTSHLYTSLTIYFRKFSESLWVSSFHLAKVTLKYGNTHDHVSYNRWL